RHRRDPFRLEDLMVGTLAALFRMAGAGFTLARAGAFAFIDPAPLPAGPRLLLDLARRFEKKGPASDRLTSALNRLGPSYVKLGQFLATRPDIVGQDASAELGRLRDEIAPFPEGDARQTVERALGRPIGDLFVSFSPAIAAASIAQVHKAEVAPPDGTPRP